MVLFCREQGKALSITLHVQSRARKTEIVGVHGECLKLKVAAPPVDNAANVEIISFFAKYLGVPKSRIELKQGATGRKKVLQVIGVSSVELTQRLLRDGLLTIKLG